MFLLQRLWSRTWPYRTVHLSRPTKFYPLQQQSPFLYIIKSHRICLCWLDHCPQTQSLELRCIFQFFFLWKLDFNFYIWIETEVPNPFLLECPLWLGSLPLVFNNLSNVFFEMPTSHLFPTVYTPQSKQTCISLSLYFITSAWFNCALGKHFSIGYQKNPNVPSNKLKCAFSLNCL